jgi:hypothetical protein
MLPVVDEGEWLFKKVGTSLVSCMPQNFLLYNLSVTIICDNSQGGVEVPTGGNRI